MNHGSYHDYFNSMPICIADTQRINGVVSLGENCIPISVNPAYLHISAHYLAHAEKAHLAFRLGQAILKRTRACIRPIERQISQLDQWLESGCKGERPCVTNSLTIRMRRQPMKVTKRNIRDYLGSLVADSMPHQIDKQFRFFIGDNGNRLILFTTENFHFLKFSVCSGLLHRSLPYPYLDYLCHDALGGNQAFLKMVE